MIPPRQFVQSSLLLLLVTLTAWSDGVGADRHRLTVSAQAGWVPTGIKTTAGRPLTVWAKGQYRVAGAAGSPQAVQVSPTGTYRFSDNTIGQPFPLPAAGAGPAPCYCLIGRIGPAGFPFYLGDERSFVAQQSGELFLAINDFDFTDNSGELECIVETAGSVYPIEQRHRVAFDGPDGEPVKDARVVVFYVDGLRPDIAEEMAAMGHLPHIHRIFLEGGSRLENSFTVFPSDTITANGTLWTGVFSDRHGIKSQIGFNRRFRRSENYLGKFGPVLNDLLLMPQGLDRLALNAGTAVTRLSRGERAARRYHDRRTSETPTLQTHLVNAGKSFGAGVMPLMSQISPDLWTRYLADEAPYFGTHLADRYVDEANTAYAIDNLFENLKDVTVVWLPENDTVSHHEYRGPFGMARRALVEADAAIGQMVDRLERKRLLESTYLILLSDHGHLGGRDFHLERFDLVNEFFHAPADVDADRKRISGGLGMSVRQDRYHNSTKGDRRDDFVFIDAMSDGVARVSLPRGGYGSGDWGPPNTARTLLRYPVRGLSKPINLFEALKSIRVTTEADSTPQSPVDLVLAKIDDRRVLITGVGRGYAVIERQRGVADEFVYRYSVVERLRPDGEDGIAWDVVEEPVRDPLALAQKVDCRLFGKWHDEETWLRITMGTLYPDSIVTMSRHMLWKPELAARENEYGVDLVVTARPGWFFYTKNEPGSAHGHPFQETMANTLFVAGPNIRRGAIVAQPVRTVDVTPTLLDMAGIDPSGLGLDGQPIRAIYRSGNAEPHVSPMPIYWQDSDLQAWAPLPWEPRPEYPRQPKTVNQPTNFWDLSNLTYNAASVREVSLNRIADDTSRFVRTRLLQQRSRDDRPLQSAFRETRQNLNEGPVELPQLQLNKVALGDYTWTSEGNLSRARNVLGWAWERTRRFDAAVSAPFGKRSFLGTAIADKAIDAADYSANEVRRVGSRVAAIIVDRWILSGIEDAADRVLNAGDAEAPVRHVSYPTQRNP